MHQLDAGDRDRRIMEPLEAKHHSDPLLDAPMVLLDQVVQMLWAAAKAVATLAAHSNDGGPTCIS